MKKKGFTLIELLVVIAIIALLMGILLPALAMVKKMAYRALCGTNLSGLYKALTTYAESYKDDYPKAGGKTTLSPVVYWLPTVNWAAPSEDYAFMTNPGKGLRRASIGASLYLLIKYVDVGPRSFICRGDSAAVVFNLYDYSGDPDFANLGGNMRNAWDFGTRTANTKGIPPAQHYSYCYQIPYGPAATAYYAPHPSRQPDLAIMADRSPYMVVNPSPQASTPNYSYNPDDPGNEEVEQWGNSDNHAREGQNVLFNNGGVTFSKVPYCGINNDNIYTMDTIPGLQQLGSLPTGTRSYNQSSFPLNGFFPQNGDDSLLLNEGLNQGGVQ